ncbi:MAG: SRPBCC family protein [Saprospiraceae bacterium]|jgi:hypothetical protein
MTELKTDDNDFINQKQFKMTIINNNAPVKCSKTISINASPEKVWNTLTNIDQWSTWQTDITKPKISGALLPGTSFVWTSGGATIQSTLQSVDPFNRLGWTGKTFGIFAIHNWTLTEANNQTQVAVDESMEGLLATLFKKAFNKSLDKSLQTWLDLLKKECEK